MRSNSASDSRYRLRCTACGAIFSDDNFRLRCEYEHKPAMLRTVYTAEKFVPGQVPTIARYDSWLPAGRAMDAPFGRPGIFRSSKLGPKLGMSNLWIAFGGWMPGRNATLPTATFTDLQAAASLSRIAAGETRALVVAAPGHSAASFAYMATALSYPVILVVNPAGLKLLSAAGRIGPTVQTVLVTDGSSEDVEAFARELASSASLIDEGGIANVARRDGAGTMLLAAVEAMGTMPDAYVQATNAGTGALGVFETSLRLIGDTGFGSVVPRLILAQNAPNTPVHDAWSRLSPRLLATKDDAGRKPPVSLLLSRTPAYAVRGGLLDALVASGGATISVENEEVVAAARAFADFEKIEIDMESAVAVAALIQSLKAKLIDPGQSVLLGITGGGRWLMRQDQKPVRPDVAVSRTTSPLAVREHLHLRDAAS
jgi:cysteate synthase